MSSVSAVNSLLGGTSTTTTPAINISNILASSVGATTPGIDVTAAVAAAIAADRAPETGWNAQVATFTSQTSALTAIQTATQAISTDLQSLNTLTGPLATRTVSSSDPTDLTATAATGTVAGTHTVVVNSLAATGAWYSDLESGPAAQLATSSFTLSTTAGQSVSFNTGAGGDTTLAALAADINSAKDSSGKALAVTATVVSDTTGSRLAIISTAPGAAADFSIASANYSGTSWTSPDIPTGSTLGANTVTLTSGGVTTNFATTEGETYAQLATAINAAGINVTATAGSDTNGTNLSLVSTDGSTPFTINEPSLGFSQAVVGANASLTVDGVPISSASNSVTGAISGVTLSLLGTTAGAPVNLTVASDATAVSTAINQFVTDYNTAVGLINTQYQVSSSSKSEGPLAPDPTVRALQNALENALNYVYTPVSGTTTAPTLDSMGISVAQDGTLSVDSTTLSNVLANNSNDVQNFFQGAALNGFASSLTKSLNTFTDAADGAFTVDLRSIASSSAAVTAEISDFETNYITPQQTVLTADFSAAEIALQQLPTEMAQIQAELGNNNGSKN